MKPWVLAAIAFVSGAALASGAWTAFPPKPSTPPPTAAPAPEAKDDSAVMKANANLTSALHECDRRLLELGERPVAVPSSTPEPPPAESGGRRERRARPSPNLSKEEWEKMAEHGVVPVRIPCIRDKPWTPSERQVDRLGLAPADVDALKAAYEASNKRMVDQIRPLCTQALGSAEAADKVGMSQCIEVINNSARKSNADATKSALSRVAEVQAGKREPPKPDPNAPAVEQLAFALTKEAKTFEDDLAARLGPEEAKRLSSAPGMCQDRHMLRAGELDPSMFGGGGGPGARNRNR